MRDEQRAGIGRFAQSDLGKHKADDRARVGIAERHGIGKSRFRRSKATVGQIGAAQQDAIGSIVRFGSDSRLSG